jgi:hypothetical protein
MMPWVGKKHPRSELKLLIVGESHYLDKDSSYHHDIESWYKGINVTGKPDTGWFNTRGIISNGINTNWKSRSKAIYKNIEKALRESKMLVSDDESVFVDLAFMNFFQRPAEVTGKSINVSEIDSLVSDEVFKSVIEIISPHIIIFTSSLAFRSAKKGMLLKHLKDIDISYARTPHSGMPWWNREAKAYGNKTGKNHFVDFINLQICAINV